MEMSGSGFEYSGYPGHVHETKMNTPRTSWSQQNSSNSQNVPPQFNPRSYNSNNNIGQIEPTQIIMNNVSYVIKEKQILKEITAVFQPGRLSVLVGPSGSGKTSLLSLIAGLKGSQPKGSRVTGDILYNGTILSPDKVKKIVGFVFQEDVILETMTVKEAINMSIELRVNLHHDRKSALRQRMLEISQLGKAENVQVGSSTKKGISGGEKKRTAIAMELVSNPSILLLDEPTSGLDTFTAFRIMALLKRLAHRYGRTVIATLHQPSSEIFHMIDDLFVLHEGEMVYGGPAQSLVPYFTEAGYQFEQYSNPLDILFMDILNRIREDEFAEELAYQGSQGTGGSSFNNRTTIVPIERLADFYRKSRMYQQHVMNVAMVTIGVTKEMHRFRAKQWHAFKLLFFRDLKNVVRNTMLVKTKLFQTIFLSAFIAAAFWNTKYSPVPALYQNLSGVLFFLVTNAFFSSFQNILPVFSAEKPSFAREHAQGYYGTGSYFLAKICVELPLTFMFPILTAVITYWSVGLRSGLNHFLLFTLILQLTALTGFSFGLFSAAIFSDVHVALALSILILLPTMIFAGLVLNVETVPAFLRWIQWVSPMRYAYTSLMTNQFVGWDSPGAQQYYNGLSAGNGFSIVVNLFILGGIFLAGLLLAYLALLRTVWKNEKGKGKGSISNIIQIFKPIPKGLPVASNRRRQLPQNRNEMTDRIEMR